MEEGKRFQFFFKEIRCTEPTVPYLPHRGAPLQPRYPVELEDHKIETLFRVIPSQHEIHSLHSLCVRGRIQG